MEKIIYIVTYYNSPNYGSNLQATALSLYLQKLGCKVYFLDRVKVMPFFIRHPQLLVARIWNKLTNYRTRRFFEPEEYKLSNDRIEKLKAYSEKFFQEISLLSINDLQKTQEQNTIFVAGSDIIWQPANGYPAKFFLDFAYYLKASCFSYASSLGSNRVPWYYKGAIRKYLSAFTSVSTREQSTAMLLSKIIGRTVRKVLDPTLLLTVADWDEFADKAQYSDDISEHYIVCYFVMKDSRYWSYVKLAQQKTGYQVVVLPMHSIDEDQPYTIIKNGTPYEFVDLIKNAEFVLTDSFHACVFSLQYEKEFYLLRRERKAEDSKYDDFLKHFHLEGRQIIDETKFERNQELDYHLSHTVLEKDREESMHYIYDALENSYKKLKNGK